MATKKECDRCGKQWEPKTQEQYSDYERGYGDKELCVVSYNLPAGAGYKQPKIDGSKELCQRCARHILKELEPVPWAEPTDKDV